MRTFQIINTDLCRTAWNNSTIRLTGMLQLHLHLWHHFWRKESFRHKTALLASSLVPFLASAAGAKTNLSYKRLAVCIWRHEQLHFAQLFQSSIFPGPVLKARASHTLQLPEPHLSSCSRSEGLKLDVKQPGMVFIGTDIQSHRLHRPIHSMGELLQSMCETLLLFFKWRS